MSLGFVDSCMIVECFCNKRMSVFWAVILSVDNIFLKALYLGREGQTTQENSVKLTATSVLPSCRRGTRIIAVLFSEIYATLRSETPASSSLMFKSKM